MLQFKMSHYNVPHNALRCYSSTCHQNVESFLSTAVLIFIHSNLTEFNTKNRDFTKDCTNLYQKYFVKSEFLKMNWFWTFLNVCRSSDRKCCHIEITISVLQRYTMFPMYTVQNQRWTNHSEPNENVRSFYIGTNYTYKYM